MAVDKRTAVIIIIVCALLVVVLVLAVVLPLTLIDKDAKSGDPLTRARWILKQGPLVDTHNDLPFSFFSNAKNQLKNVDLLSNTLEQWPDAFMTPATDIPRLKEGMVGAQFWVAFTSCTTEDTDTVRRTLELIDVIERMIAKYPDVFERATSSKEIETAFNNGKIASLFAIEGGHSIDSSLGALRMFYQLGVRYLTLTHNCNTPWVDNHVVDANDTLPRIGGLSGFGKTVIKEMNRIGMMVDLSHVSYDTMVDALDVTEAPVIFSHSSAYKLCNSTRNVHDDILKRTKENGGIVMVNFYSKYITCTENATLKDVADHVEYIRDVAGVDHVGLGADYDGVDILPVGLEDVSTYPDLFAELVERGWSNDDLIKLAGENFLRVFKKVEEVRDSKRNLLPFEDLVPPSAVKNRTCRATFEEATSF